MTMYRRATGCLAWIRNPRALGRAVWAGLVGVILCMVFFATLSTVSTHFAVGRVHQANDQQNAYATANLDLATEESLAHEYLVQPSPEVRRLHTAAASALVSNLQMAAQHTAEPADLGRIDDLLAIHAGYLASAAHLFAVVDLGDVAAVDAIDVHEVNPAYSSLDAGVTALADAAELQTLQMWTALDDLEHIAVVAEPTTFGLAFALLALFWVVLGRFQRHMDRAAARFRSIVQNASDVVTILRADSTVDYASPAADQVWAVSPAGLLGTEMLASVHPDDVPAARAHLTETIRQPATNIATELRIPHGDGSWRSCAVVANNLLSQPAVAGIVMTYSDVTERKRFEDQLMHVAFHDPLTGLPNRALFTDRLERALPMRIATFGRWGCCFSTSTISRL